MKKTKEIERYLKYQKKLRALSLVKEGLKVMEVCDILKISKTTFYNWKNKYQKEGKKGRLDLMRPMVIELVMKQ